MKELEKAWKTTCGYWVEGEEPPTPIAPTSKGMAWRLMGPPSVFEDEGGRTLVWTWEGKEPPPSMIESIKAFVGSPQGLAILRDLLEVPISEDGS